MGLALVVVLILVAFMFALRVALFRRQRIAGRARSFIDGPLAPVRRFARRRRSGR